MNAKQIKKEARERYKILDEVGYYAEIPDWFNKFVKKAKTKRTFICWGRNYSKNWFYNWWEKHNPSSSQTTKQTSKGD